MIWKRAASIPRNIDLWKVYAKIITIDTNNELNYSACYIRANSRPPTLGTRTRSVIHLERLEKDIIWVKNGTTLAADQDDEENEKTTSENSNSGDNSWEQSRQITATVIATTTALTNDMLDMGEQNKTKHNSSVFWPRIHVCNEMISFEMSNMPSSLKSCRTAFNPGQGQAPLNHLTSEIARNLLPCLRCQLHNVAREHVCRLLVIEKAAYRRRYQNMCRILDSSSFYLWPISW